MSRPTKCRRVCHFPHTPEFIPRGALVEEEPVVMAVDEYETIRLIDREGLSQEQCAACMQIARTTVQRIYETARRKLADCLVDGRPLRIEGGDFQLCNGQSVRCGHGDCFRHFHHQCKEKLKKENIMRVATTYDNGEIFQHFGHTQQFKVYDIEDGEITSVQVVGTGGSGHGALAGVLSALAVDVLICGGIGGGAQAALAEAGIRLCGGVSGSADDAVAAFMADRLDFNPDVRCSHHEHSHEEGHTCGHHGCGAHTCHS